MWSAATVVGCALGLLGRAETSFPPIALIEQRPVDVSAHAEAFVRAGDNTIYLLTASRVFSQAQRADLPCGAINALKNADLNLVVDLVQKNEADLEHVKNLGEKSIDEIKTALATLGLSLGMRIDPNVLGALGRGGIAR